MPKRWINKQGRPWATRPRRIKGVSEVVEACRKAWKESEYRNEFPGQMLGDGREDIVKGIFESVPGYKPEMQFEACTSIALGIRYRQAKGESDAE